MLLSYTVVSGGAPLRYQVVPIQPSQFTEQWFKMFNFHAIIAVLERGFKLWAWSTLTNLGSAADGGGIICVSTDQLYPWIQA